MESSSCTNDSSTAMMALVSHGQSSQSKEWDSSSTTPTAAPLSTPTPAPTSIPNEPPNDSSLPPLPTPNGGTKKKAKETSAVWDYWKKVKRDERDPNRYPTYMCKYCGVVAPLYTRNEILVCGLTLDLGSVSIHYLGKLLIQVR